MYFTCTNSSTVNQQILAAIKLGVSQNKVIWRLLNLASPSLCSVRSTYDHLCWRTNISENTQFAKFHKYNSTPKFVDLQYLLVGLLLFFISFFNLFFFHFLFYFIYFLFNFIIYLFIFLFFFI